MAETINESYRDVAPHEKILEQREGFPYISIRRLISVITHSREWLVPYSFLFVSWQQTPSKFIASFSVHDLV